MIAAFGTLAFLATLWLLVVVGALDVRRHGHVALPAPGAVLLRGGVPAALVDLA